jgi:hypothetical protein
LKGDAAVAGVDELMIQVDDDSFSINDHVGGL